MIQLIWIELSVTNNCGGRDQAVALDLMLIKLFDLESRYVHKLVPRPYAQGQQRNDRDIASGQPCDRIIGCATSL